MPPHPTSTTLSRIEHWTTSNDWGHLIKFFLLLSVLVAAVQTTVIISKQRKRRMSDTTVNEVKNPLPTPPTPEKDPNQYLQSLKQETLEPERGPIYPWIAPPQRLPGPYDAPYYPLPLPTIRRHSHDPSNVETEESSDTSTISYTRRVSTNSITDQEAVLEGSISTSTQGWRRNHWTVIAD